MGKPFAGVKVLDFTRVLAGPFASQQIALLGADVIKVEALTGDDARYGFLSPEGIYPGTAPGWMAVNANKRSLTLDLKKPKAIAIVKRLTETADVVMENFRPGVMESLGIGYAALSAVNPKLIYCAISGFGHSGPERQTAAFDGMIQAMSGLMSITGFEETGPTRAGFAACDVISGMTGAFAVASALYQRTHTDKGQFVDVAMLDATLNFLRQQVVEYTVAGYQNRQRGNLSVTRKPTADMYRTRDGYLVLAVLSEKQFAALLSVLGLTDVVLKDPRFKDWPARIENGPALKAIIEQALASDDATAWAERFKQADVPCGRVSTIDEIVHHPQLAHRDLLQPVQGRHGDLTLVGSGFRLDHGNGAVERAPPELGEHTDEILREAGYTAGEVAALRDEKVV